MKIGLVAAGILIASVAGVDAQTGVSGQPASSFLLWLGPNTNSPRRRPAAAE